MRAGCGGGGSASAVAGRAGEGAQARQASARGWRASRISAHGGVGAENYARYIKHVLLLPYSAGEIRVIGEREYQRQPAFEDRGVTRPRDPDARAGHIRAEPRMGASRRMRTCQIPA